MSRPDTTASAALGAQIIRPVFFCYLDIVGDPLRANTGGQDFALTGTGDGDLDGHTYFGIDPTFVDIGSVRARDGGSDTVVCKLSGLVDLDTDLLNIIGTSTNWQGRTARLWRMIRDAGGTQQGAIQHYYTGWMTSLKISGSPGNQMILLSIESYLAAYSQASNRTYLDQEAFDPGDQSAKAAIALANGNRSTTLTSSTPVYGGGGGDGGSIDLTQGSFSKLSGFG